MENVLLILKIYGGIVLFAGALVVSAAIILTMISLLRKYVNWLERKMKIECGDDDA